MHSSLNLDLRHRFSRDANQGSGFGVQENNSGGTIMNLPDHRTHISHLLYLSLCASGQVITAVFQPRTRNQAPGTFF